MTKKIKATISGMHCAACSANVERAVGKIKGIKSVSVSVMTNKAIIEADDSLKLEEIKKVIDGLGYKVVSIA